MAAASNKPGGVHYALIIFVMSTVVLGIVAYMFHRDMSDKANLLDQKVKVAQQQEKRLKDMDDQIQLMKRLIGRVFELVEDPANGQNPNTVKAAALKDMDDFGKDLKGENFAQTLQKLREALEAALADTKSKAGQVDTLQKQVVSETNRLNAQIDTVKKAQSSAEAEKRDVISQQSERIRSKDDEIAKLIQEKNGLQTELAQEQEQHNITKKQMKDRIGALEKIVDARTDEIDRIQKLSFEIPKGLIQRVDNVSKTVIINLGYADFLKERMTFSVYGKENQGVGRGAEDIKGKIEVTRIVGDHMAEARIIDDELLRPMVVNDMIYTPLWSPGLVEQISLCGLIDLDGDGFSDREELHKIIGISGAKIDNEVDDDGKRIPEDGKITVQTKFLVIGNIPDPSRGRGEAEAAKFTKIREMQTEMRSEARISGVRVIKLNDFLAFIGFESKRRSFRPGQVKPYDIKAGSTPTAIDKSSAGHVSSIFLNQQRKSAPQPESSGNVSKLFGGKPK